MLEPVLLPRPVRVLNALGEGLRALGFPLVPLRPRALKSRAVKLAGLDDFGETEFEEGLAVLCRSAEQDAGLHLAGRLAVRDQITASLVTRLLRVEARKRRPEVFRRPLVPPLIVVGLHRSGTTYLHRLLSLGPRARPLALWEVWLPLAGPGPDRRREEAAALVARMKRAAPGLDAKHPLDTDLPEECMFLLNSSLNSMGFWWLAPVYGYLTWYLEQDQQAAYRAYREHLQLFQADDPRSRLVLKAPVHTGHLEALLCAVPEAMIVQTHRDPATAITSANSLLHTLHGLVTSSEDPRRMAIASTDALSRLVQRNLADRARMSEGRVFDVRYEALTSDPLGTVRGVHRHFDLPFDAAFQERLERWIERDSRRGAGRHVYTAEEFGISEAQLDARFAEYRKRFLDRELERPAPARSPRLSTPEKSVCEARSPSEVER